MLPTQEHASKITACVSPLAEELLAARSFRGRVPCLQGYGNWLVAHAPVDDAIPMGIWAAQTGVSELKE